MSSIVLFDTTIISLLLCFSHLLIAQFTEKIFYLIVCIKRWIIFCVHFDPINLSVPNLTLSHRIITGSVFRTQYNTFNGAFTKMFKYVFPCTDFHFWDPFTTLTPRGQIISYSTHHLEQTNSSCSASKSSLKISSSPSPQPFTQYNRDV